jgi:hypothetical protein
MANFNRYITANETITRVLKIMGLRVPVSAATSQDATVRQLWAMLTELGQYLLDQNEWQMQTRTYQLTTTPPDLEYDLPEDFQYIVNSSGWNETARIPLIGPLTSQQWRLLQARQLGGTTLRMQYIIEDGKIKFYFVPPDAQTIAFDMVGRSWVRDATDPLIFRDYVENDADVVLYPPRLIMNGLRFWWRRAKGLEYSSDEEEFNKALEDAKYNDKPKNDLSLNNQGGFPYLGYLNMPDTNYGP